MYKAVIMRSSYENPAPTSKEIQDYFRKSGKLLYGNDKRKSKNTPFEGTIHLVMHAFNEFEELIIGKKTDYKAIRCAYRMCRTKGGASFALFGQDNRVRQWYGLLLPDGTNA